MNLRNFKGEYNIGLDLGTASVGWAVTDADGRLLHFKKQPTWGSRLFDGAKTAAEARSPRGQRRRYVRRRWRLDLLQSLLQEEVEKVDPDFFLRLRQSRLVKDDPNKTTSEYRWPIFNDDDFTEADYYKKFPTIYHLRAYLMEADEQADIRLVYLALHNIVKCRGNFLREGQDLSAKNADSGRAVDEFLDALREWCDSQGAECAPAGTGDILKVLAADDASNSDKAREIAVLLRVSFGEGASDKKLNKALANGMVGLKAEFGDVFAGISAEKTKISLSDDEAADALLEACPDDGRELLEALRAVHSAYVLQGLLSYAPGETISVNMVAKYRQYQNDLRLLKELVRQYKGRSKEEKCYDEFFRGALRTDGKGYDEFSAKGYTKYNLGKTTYDDFAKEVGKLFAGTRAEEDDRFKLMMEGFGNQKFLRRLKTSDNGSIYYQLHLEEMRLILRNQGKYYPVLLEESEKLLSLVSFRIPYYVGPLTQRNARLDAHEKPRFAWSERKQGMEGVAIAPWNWDEVIDKNKSAENFIRRMTGICTYLQGEDVLPKSSLLYEEFCVLNELNGAKWTADGDKEFRFDDRQREGIVNDLFRRYKTISYKRVEDWLAENGYASSPRVFGGQGATGFESKLGSHLFFAKDIFGTGKIEDSDRPMIEEVILWSTLFEDRSILKEKLWEKYGPSGEGKLDEGQIKKICKKRLVGWGRLSEKFLTGMKVDTSLGKKSIMDVLQEGDPNPDTRQGRAMVLMEVLHDDKLGFQKEIDAFNRAYFEQAGDALGVNDLPGSPAVRRGLNQALKIVDEVARIAGKAPASIFIEVARDDDMSKKGKRTTRRYDNLKEAIAAVKAQEPQLWREINGVRPEDLDERLTLYFMQGGKCLYSGKPLDITRLSNAGLYEVDHIIPQSYIKDDSYENKALVLREENQRKTDAMLLDPAIRRRMSGYWKSLHDAGLIGDKKFNNLMRSSIGENAMRGFIARQLVETSQMMKFARALLGVKYPDTKIVSVKASMSHNLREAAGFAKCREANDFHHAHDAFLACRMGLFIQRYYPDIYENPIVYAKAMRKYVREQAEGFNKSHSAPGSSGFVVGSFLGRGIDFDTGEIEWDGPEEVEVIRRTLNYRQCYISRMPVEDSGAFWNATIYSPRDPKMGAKLSLPLKKDLDPQVYGGYSSQQFAYFFIYEALDKKGRTVFRFAEVPVWLAPRIRDDENVLAEYAKGLAEGEKLEFVGIQRAKILKKQLIEIDGERFFITGKKKMRNAVQVAFSSKETSVLRDLLLCEQGSRSSNRPHEDQIGEIFDRLIAFGKQNLGRLFDLVKIDTLKCNLCSLNEESKNIVLLRLLALVNGADVDLSIVGGAKSVGCLQPSYSKLLTDPGTDFYIIDQSVTGMFEKRTRVGL